ncbi:OBAP family protein [uncultured Chitinophaga sp.]|jgi:Protein of unknown function (DUF1264).|uniref:OBAP family protein n=1 Tax=uncultured Chitinophaga sp. TaxID=339340 RepID=UPI0026357863|nr:OBAP family protein [uncultured Chitinophaga sp.]
MRLWFLLLPAALLTACGGKNTRSKVEAPGADKKTDTRALEAGADVLQDKSPLKRFNVYLDGFHFYNGNMQAQMEAHHYVSQLNEELHQAVIFDGNGADAKIMGVEYIISERLFKTLPEEEKLLWHSHQYEVKSGELIAPGIPDAAEHALMKKLVSTYGKTIHTWHTDQQRTLPLGSPMIMMGFTKDGQLQPSLIQQRDQRFNTSTADKRQQRADIVAPPVAAGANAWERGIIRQFVITDKVDSAAHKQQMHH